MEISVAEKTILQKPKEEKKAFVQTKVLRKHKREFT